MRAHIAFAALVALAALVVSGGARAGEPLRLLVVPLEADEEIPDNARAALEDAVRAQADKAATDRGYTLVSLDQVRGLKDELASCHDTDCRVAAARRVKATHVLAGRLEFKFPRPKAKKKSAQSATAAESGSASVEVATPRDLKKDAPIRIDVTRPKGFVLGPSSRMEKPTDSGYRVWLWLEDVGTSDFVDAAKLEGDVPYLTGRLREAVDDLLEAGAPREDAIRTRLLKTAESYRAAGRTKDAIRTLRRAVDVNPLHPAAVAIQLDVVKRFAESGDLDGEAAALDETVALYGPESAWAHAGIGGEKLQKDVGARLEALLNEHATRALAFAQGNTTGDGPMPNVTKERALEIAADGFSDLADAYPLTERGMDARFFVGEIAFEQKRFDAAAEAYAEVAATEGGKRRADAALARMYSLEELLKTKAAEPGYAPFPPKGEGATRDLPLEARAFVDGAASLLEIAPFKKASPAFGLRAGEVLLSYGQREEARQWFKRVADKYPESDAGRAAASRLNPSTPPPTP